jgi:hypothetical protein
VPGPGGLQRRALQALTGSALAHAAGDREEAAALLARAVAHAAESKDGPVTAAVAERAAAHALADGDPHTAAALLGVAAGQRGALDVGDPDVRVTLDAVGAALGAAVLDAVVAEARARPRADGVARLGDYVRARAGGTVAGSDSVPASASASATSRE